MDLEFGINGGFGVEAARPISVDSSTPLAMAVTADTTEIGIKKFNNATDGLTFVKDNNITAGTLKVALKGIELQGVNCPIVLHISTHDAIEATNITNILAGLTEIKQSSPLTGIDLKNGLVFSPVYSANTQVAAKIDSISSTLWCPGSPIDNFSDVEAGVVDFLSNFGSKYIYHGTGYYKADGENIPMSSLIAGHIARCDVVKPAGGNDPFGWAKNHSNRVVLGVAGTTRNNGKGVEYYDSGDSEAKRLRKQGCASIVKDVGWRLYGFETRDIDPIWQSLDRVRAFHRMLAAIIKASKWARDREADELVWVKKSIVEFNNEMIGAKVGIGFEVFFDPKKNTAATVTAGKFYLTIKFQDMPSIRELNIELIYSDKWGETLINYINGGE
ncbi:hypothetical protein [Sulfurimonas sp.]|uniref:hypothetical protein n=1 Tax=Sulfurimonas sp. TaxID=2022749 RepID=UPI0025DCB3F9|nr:hypothetical protein [Sulfurimonas sp.]